MNQENINKIYEALINGMVLTDKLLQELGFFNKQIDELLRIGILETTKDGKYQLTTIDGLRQYGIDLLHKKNTRRANLCFKKCHELNPYDRNSALQLLLAALIENDFNKVEKIFATLEKNCTKEEDKGFNNIVIYLLSCISELKEEYREQAKNMSYENTRHITLESQKGWELRSLIIRGRFPHAFHVISEIIKENKFSLELIIIKELLYKAVIAEKKFRAELLKLAREEQYKEIFYEIEKKKERRKLRTTEENSYLIVKNILEILETGTLENINSIDTANLHVAIENKNFKLAEIINEVFLNDANIPKNEDVVSILLSKINKLIDEFNINEEKEELPFVLGFNDEEHISIQPASEEPSLKEEKSNNLTDTEELAYYIASQNMNLETAKRKMGILPEQVLLIKLVYARDYYIEGNYIMGDKLIKEVESSFIITPAVTKHLNEIKANRNVYKEQKETTKKRTKNL